MESIRLGLIGCGQAAAVSHLPALRFVPAVEVAAISDIHQPVSNSRDRFHIERRFTNYRSLLEDPTIEAIAVWVPAQLHVEVASAVLEAGRHLFLEKPLALGLRRLTGGSMSFSRWHPQQTE